MAIEVDGLVYYRTSEACARAGVSRATLFRWLRAGILEQCHRDRRGWRVFTEDDIKRIRTEARRIVVDRPIGSAKDREAVAGSECVTPASFALNRTASRHDDVKTGEDASRL